MDRIFQIYLKAQVPDLWTPPPFFFKFFNSSLLWDVFIINSVEQLQTLPKTQSEIDISPFLKTQKPSILYSIILKFKKKRGGFTNRVPMSKRWPRQYSQALYHFFPYKVIKLFSLQIYMQQYFNSVPISEDS